MILTVVKRDGRIVGFNEQKVMAAIRKAMLHTDKGEDERLIYKITDYIAQKGESQMTVEQIQDAVEMELMKSSRKDVAQKFIAYRNQRSIARKAKTRDVFLDIVNIKNNDVTRENANMNADTPAGMMMKFASETSTTTSTSTTKTITPPSRSPACSTPSTISSPAASLPDMAPRALPSASRPPRCWLVSRWSAPRTRCTADRPSLPSTSTWHPTCA